mmetsp:Transcript_20770/g.66736  ORF Transcript_20770/g.66736 Transcript_20770/m.66736 type:complete len:227 (+) Transcript_20770:162-842(+)
MLRANSGHSTCPLPSLSRCRIMSWARSRAIVSTSGSTCSGTLSGTKMAWSGVRWVVSAMAVTLDISETTVDERTPSSILIRCSISPAPRDPDMSTSISSNNFLTWESRRISGRAPSPPALAATGTNTNRKNSMRDTSPLLSVSIVRRSFSTRAMVGSSPFVIHSKFLSSVRLSVPPWSRSTVSNATSGVAAAMNVVWSIHPSIASVFRSSNPRSSLTSSSLYADLA